MIWVDLFLKLVEDSSNVYRVADPWSSMPLVLKLIADWLSESVVSVVETIMFQKLKRTDS